MPRRAAAAAALLPPAFLRSEEAARLLEVSANTLRRYVRQKRLTVQKTFGGHNRYSRAELEALRERLRADGTPAPAALSEAA